MVPTKTRKEAATGNVTILGVDPLQAVTNHFPQAGGYQVTETPEVVCNLIQRDEDMGTPLPDYCLGSISAPVGHLLFFRRDWKMENAQTMC